MEKEIGKIPKNTTTDIVLRIDDFGGRIGLTIREFVTEDRYTGFTKSGVRIPAEEFSKFKEMINSIDEKFLKPKVESFPEGQETLDVEQEEIKIERPGEEESETESDEETEEQEELPDY